MYPYCAYENLRKEFVQTVGYAGKLEIPDALVRKLAEFIDAHPNDMMTAYYARSLLDMFYRKKTEERSIRLFNRLNSFLVQKSALLELFLHGLGDGQNLSWFENYDIATIWQAISSLNDGYSKANYIGRFSHRFTDEIAGAAYDSMLAMPDTFKIRGLAGIYPRMDAVHKAEILSYLLQQFVSGAAEAAYQLKLKFPHMDKNSRAKVIDAHLEIPGLSERFIAYLAIRNTAYLQPDDANRIVARAKTFESDYLRNRCLLKLAAYLHEEEIENLYDRFMEDFHSQAASTASIHNLYQFGAVVKKLEKSRVVSLALQKIAALDDSQNEVFNQEKYGQMLFIMPLLTEVHREHAFDIAETVRGGYKKTLKGRLRAHFASSKNFCTFLYSPICF